MLKISLAALVLVSNAALAASPQLQGAIIVGSGGTLTITRMPITTANGIIYRDVTIQLQADENGNVSFARGRPGSPAPASSSLAQPTPSAGEPVAREPGLAEVQPLTQAPSKPVKVQEFRVGTYRGDDGSLMKLVGGGKAVLEGVPIWTFTAIDGSAAITSATWYEGLITDNPRQRKIQNAGITSLDYSYGTSDEGESRIFGAGALIGATMTGSTLTVVSFHKGCCNGAVPTASLTYTYVGR